MPIPSLTNSPYVRLMRLDRPIGTWLLLLPCWWGVALASGKFPDLGFMLLFAVGAVIMRGAGCIVNDIYDRKLDEKVERTRTRPLASGEIEIWQALALLTALLIAGFAILTLFNRATIVIGCLSLPLIFSYPLMKRFTWWPQLFLGFTFNWGVWMGWSAATGGIAFPPLLLYVAGIFWTLGYDTIYAHQDIRDDALVGIKSTARLFGANSWLWVASFYALTIVFLALTGWTGGLGKGFYVLLIAAAGFCVVQLASWEVDDPANCLQRFKSNRDFGFIVLAAIITGKFL